MTGGCHPAVKALRLLIQSGDLATYEARRLVLQVGNLLPASVPDRDALREELRTAIDIVLVAHALYAPDETERGFADRALDAIEARLTNG